MAGANQFEQRAVDAGFHEGGVEQLALNPESASDVRSSHTGDRRAARRPSAARSRRGLLPAVDRPPDRAHAAAPAAQPPPARDDYRGCATRGATPSSHRRGSSVSGTSSPRAALMAASAAATCTPHDISTNARLDRPIPAAVRNYSSSCAKQATKRGGRAARKPPHQLRASRHRAEAARCQAGRSPAPLPRILSHS
jgi:hypothetical protein